MPVLVDVLSSYSSAADETDVVESICQLMQLLIESRMNPETPPFASCLVDGRLQRKRRNNLQTMRSRFYCKLLLPQTLDLKSSQRSWDWHWFISAMNAFNASW